MPASVDRGEGPLRHRVTRGVVINGVFLGVVNGLALLRGALVVVFLTAADYGVWGIVSAVLALAIALRQNGIADRYVQQDDGDPRHAFQVAFTLEVVFSGVLLALGLVLMPAVALMYGRPELLAPGLVLLLVLPGLALQSPLAIFQRRLDFRRQRTLQSVDPIVAFAVTIPLVAAGAGYWGIVAGAVAGAWSAAIVALRACPYELSLRWDREAARRYARFSWPMLVAAVAAAVMAQALMLGAESHIGLAGAGVIALSLTVSQYANRVDQIVSSALYPALCAVRARTEVVLESFITSNRAGILWGAPLGLALAVFAQPLADHVLGADWTDAVIILQASGIVVAIHRLGYNWDTFFRAAGRTREIALNAGIVTAGFFLVPVPLLILGGMEGAAAGILALELISLATRSFLLRRLLPVGRALGGCLRSMAPALAAAAAVLALRALLPGDGSAERAGIEAAVFAAVVLIAAAGTERALVREVMSYGRRAPVTPAAS